MELVVQLAVVHHVVHSTLHLQEHPLFLPLGDAAESHSISGHAYREALLEATLLTTVAVNPHDGAALVFKALLILDVLLNASSEEALAAFTGMNTVVESGCHIATHFT